MKPILVIGDTCSDVFFYGTCERLAPDSPVPVLDIVKQEKTLGMAGNVYRNIIDLDFPCEIVTNNNYHEITKTRYVDIKTNHMFIRIDSQAEYSPIDRQTLEALPWDHCSAVVISDYDKGFLSEKDIQYIAEHHPLTFLDTKKVLGEWANDITFIKINRKEYRASLKCLTPRLQLKIIETLGADGCKYLEQIFPVKLVEIKNLSGAGDSFLAGLAVSFVKTENMNIAIPFANSVATKVVQKLGIGTIKG